VEGQRNWRGWEDWGQQVEPLLPLGLRSLGVEDLRWGWGCQQWHYVAHDHIVHKIQRWLKLRYRNWDSSSLLEEECSKPHTGSLHLDFGERSWDK